MSTGLKFFGVLLGVPAIVIGLLLVNAFIYPFSSKNPNYADVEQAFAKLQFPSEWQEISSSENRGIAGRGCDPFNSSGCFHKRKTFSVPSSTTTVEVSQALKSAGCVDVSIEGYKYNDTDKSSYNLRCAVDGGIIYSSNLSGTENHVSIGSSTY